ncbi:MAG TPA: cytochrome C peroxidase, partial [Byssovorax sp.]
AASGTQGVSLAPRGVAAGPRVEVTAQAPRCARARDGAVPKPLGSSARGGAVALARLGAATIAYAADEDQRAIHAFDVERAVELAVTPLPGAPHELVVLADGRVAATLRDTNRVVILEPQADASRPLELRCEAAVAVEPVGVAATAAGDRVVVTSAFGRKLTVFDSSDLSTVAAIDLPRDPRAVLLSPDGARAFVSHAVGGALSVVDLAPDRAAPRRVNLGVGSVARPRKGVQGFALASIVVGGAARVFAPYVSVDPGPPEMATAGYGGGAFEVGPPAEVPVAAAVDEATEAPLSHVLSLSTDRRTGECLLPRAATTRGDALYVTCLGSDELLELDARATDPFTAVRRRFDVPAGPTGVAIDDEHGRAVVWSQFRRQLSRIDLLSNDAVADVRAARRARVDGRVVIAAFERDDLPPELSGAIARGRELFHRTDDRRVSKDGRACASCHPDGREDGITWSTPDGARQTPMLAGRLAGTAPYGWMGKHATLHEHLEQTMKRLGGTGFEKPADQADLAALVAYLGAMKPPSRPGAAADASRASLAAEGHALFDDATQGCATCHADGGTDHATHDVGTSARIDTPSLAFVAGTAPYFHDGRYATLMELLDAHDDRMGRTMHLGAAQKLALAAYLETL